MRDAVRCDQPRLAVDDADPGYHGVVDRGLQLGEILWAAIGAAQSGVGPRVACQQDAVGAVEADRRVVTDGDFGEQPSTGRSAIRPAAARSACRPDR